MFRKDCYLNLILKFSYLSVLVSFFFFPKDFFFSPTDIHIRIIWCYFSFWDNLLRCIGYLPPWHRWRFRLFQSKAWSRWWTRVKHHLFFALLTAVFPVYHMQGRAILSIGFYLLSKNIILRGIVSSKLYKKKKKSSVNCLIIFICIFTHFKNCYFWFILIFYFCNYLYIK